MSKVLVDLTKRERNYHHPPCECKVETGSRKQQRDDSNRDCVYLSERQRDIKGQDVSALSWSKSW